MSTEQIRQDVLEGLNQSPKRVPSKYFYDALGSQLFERITELDEYYPTRTEISLMRHHASAISDRLGEGVTLVEYGSGSGLKTRLLLDFLVSPRAYVAVEISQTALDQSTQALREMFPGLDVQAVHADYTREFQLPVAADPRKVVYFPGSTVGNFTIEQAVGFLQRIADQVGEGGGLLIGVDLKKDPQILHRAYNDSDGVTAEFNLNVLRRINTQLDANFALDAFHHYAFYDPVRGRIEMHLVSDRCQDVTIDGDDIAFERGETILTEYSYKYTEREFDRLAAEAGLQKVDFWTDPNRHFGLFYYEAA